MAEKNDFLQFRFVPTMRCNLHCPYCFLSHSSGSEPTMFDVIPVTRWIEAMSQYKSFDVEFYCWGGEPFILDETYELINGFLKYQHVKWGRIDTNMVFSKKIAQKMADSRVKLNCSWHTHAFNFEQIWERVNLLNASNMVGMVNLVASRENLDYLKNNNLNIHDLVNQFQDNGIFLNIAADFHIVNDLAYRELITRYTTVLDWSYIHGEIDCKGVQCDASNTFFNVDIANGNLTSCGYKPGLPASLFGSSSLGNFIEGRVISKGIRPCPQEECKSIVSYCHQTQNNFKSQRHLDDYVKRNIEHRFQTGVYK